MSELIDNARRRKDLLKHMILQLHSGHAPDLVRTQLVRALGQVPYGEVVEVEQELISEGMPVEDVLRLCDVHTEAMAGVIDDSGARTAPPGHPVHTMQFENRALMGVIEGIEATCREVHALPHDSDAVPLLRRIRAQWSALMDVEKHYLRKENLLFPHLEKRGITGPPTVMWGKHDETRELLAGAVESLDVATLASGSEARLIVDLALRPATDAVAAMVDKEEQILLPMCLDALTDVEWAEIHRQSPEIGFCLVDPMSGWTPDVAVPVAEVPESGARIQLPTGSLALAELTAVLGTVPVDMTFVDRDDTVRWFSHGKERVFARTRAILGRKVQFCHPPSSVHVVTRILDAFKAGAHDRAAFWIELHGRFVSIEYFAMRDEAGAYLGTLEVTQDLTEKRALTGERRLLAFDGGAPEEVSHG